MKNLSKASYKSQHTTGAFPSRLEHSPGVSDGGKNSDKRRVKPKARGREREMGG